jgi:hypothetical protein
MCVLQPGVEILEVVPGPTQTHIVVSRPYVPNYGSRVFGSQSLVIED